MQAAYNEEPNTKNFQDLLKQNSMTVEIRGKKSCTTWSSFYDTKTGTHTRIRTKVSTRPSILDIELVDIECKRMDLARAESFVKKTVGVEVVEG